MVIVRIPKGPDLGYREVCGNFGDLVLFCYTQQISVKNNPFSATLGVFLGIESVLPKRSVGRKGAIPRDDMKIGSPLTIKPYIQLGGINIPMISKPNRQSPDYFIINKSLRELHFGKENIIKCLNEWNGFFPHADLISKMQEPYLR
ncbi:hypothetical protein GOV12_04965 [Candidatus Pacearchaeota archaeon]|nr:hypothetical protein [Candidatus Pacearchaeota archaeon]